MGHPQDVWRVAGGSARGKGHIDMDLPCQDKCLWRVDHGRVVAVVCDGAGSASHSDAGAALCTQLFVDEVWQALKDEALNEERANQIGEHLHHGLLQKSESLQLPLRELACTLVGIAANATQTWLFHVGDGFCVAELSDGSRVLSLPDNGEYANETRFITQADWRDFWRVTQHAQGVKRAALMSDGAMPFAVAKDKQSLFSPFIDPLRNWLESASDIEACDGILAILDKPATWAITSDDKTLVLIEPALQKSTDAANTQFQA